MASELKSNDQRENFNSLNENPELGNTSPSKTTLTEDHLECLERDIATARLFYGDVHDSSILFFKNLFAEGVHQPIDFDVPLNDKPEWLDIEKFHRGRRFALNNISGILFAELISIVLLFSIKIAVAPLIFTRATDSPFKCLLRYTSTFRRLKSWYDEDIWSDESNDGKKNLRVVRAMHKNLHLAMSACPEEELKKKILLENTNLLPSKFPLVRSLKEDAKSFCGFTPEIQFDKISKIWVSQTAMAFVQWGFVGLAATYPENFGIHHAKEEDLDAFVHMWKGIGYKLGIKDEFNLCTGDLKSVRERTKCIVDLVIVPFFKDVSLEWEYMGRCVVDGGSYHSKGISFEMVVLYMFHVLNLQTPKLRKFVTGWQLFGFYFLRFVFEYLCRFRIILKILNFLTLKRIRMMEEATPELLSQWKEKSFFYIN